MLALADSRGMVESSVPGLAVTAGVTLEECEAALHCFLSPDKYSRTKDHEGRRIHEKRGGWLIINHSYYREFKTEKQIKDAERQTRFRASKLEAKKCDMSRMSQEVAADPDPDPDPKTDLETKSGSKSARTPVATPVPNSVGVSRTYTLSSQEPPKAYLDEALMAGVSDEQARSTWEHYRGAGLPPNGVERLYAWLTKRAKERANQTTKTPTRSGSSGVLTMMANELERQRAEEAEDDRKKGNRP
jgi:hypothetical protein